MAEQVPASFVPDSPSAPASFVPDASAQAASPIADNSTISARPSLGSRLWSALKQGGASALGEELGNATRESVGDITLPGLHKTLGEGLKDLGQMANMAGTEASMLAGPEAGAARLPSAERAGATMNALRESIGTHPVEITDKLSKATVRIQELADNGNTMSSAARKFINRITDPAKGHLTYSEARDFMTKFGSMTAEETAKIAPAMKSAIQRVGAELGEAVKDTADRAGKLVDFQKSMSEYRNAKIVKDVVDWAKDFSLKGIAQKATLGGAVMELKHILSK